MFKNSPNNVAKLIKTKRNIGFLFDVVNALDSIMIVVSPKDTNFVKYVKSTHVTCADSNQKLTSKKRM